MNVTFIFISAWASEYTASYDRSNSGYEKFILHIVQNLF